MASKSAYSPKTRQQKKSGKEPSAKAAKPSSSQESTNFTSDQNEAYKEVNRSRNEQMTKEVQQSYGAKPQDIVCGYIPDMLNLLLSQQDEMMTVIRDLKTKVSCLENQNTDLSEKISKLGKQIPVNVCDEHSQSGNIVNQDKSSNILQILLEEREINIIKSNCQDIKSNMSLNWNSQLKKRELHFRNFVKNAKKAELYENWISNYPEYIPYKYRPKRIRGELPKFTEARISEAKFKYRTECKLMFDYATHHREKYTDIDHQMKVQFTKDVDKDEYIGGLVEMWKRDTKENEVRAEQLWSRNEKFLKKMKFEDDKMCDQAHLTDITLDEKLKTKNRKAPKKHMYNIQCDSRPIPPQPWYNTPQPMYRDNNNYQIR